MHLSMVLFYQLGCVCPEQTQDFFLDEYIDSDEFTQLM